MPRMRAAKTGKYAITKHEFYTCLHFAYQYQEWLDKYNALSDSVKAITSDGMPHGMNVSNPTEHLAIKRSELKDKMDLIDTCVLEAVDGDKVMYEFLHRGVTDERVNCNYLVTTMNMPCSRNTYYAMRRRFYYYLSQKI